MCCINPIKCLWDVAYYIMRRRGGGHYLEPEV